MSLSGQPLVLGSSVFSPGLVGAGVLAVEHAVLVLVGRRRRAAVGLGIVGRHARARRGRRPGDRRRRRRRDRAGGGQPFLAGIVAAHPDLVGAGVLAVEDAVGVAVGRAAGSRWWPDRRCARRARPGQASTSSSTPSPSRSGGVAEREPLEPGQEAHRRRALAGGDAGTGPHRQPDLVGEHEAGPEQQLGRGGALAEEIAVGDLGEGDQLGADEDVGGRLDAEGERRRTARGRCRSPGNSRPRWRRGS